MDSFDPMLTCLLTWSCRTRRLLQNFASFCERLQVIECIQIEHNCDHSHFVRM